MGSSDPNNAMDHVLDARLEQWQNAHVMGRHLALDAQWKSTSCSTNNELAVNSPQPCL